MATLDDHTLIDHFTPERITNVPVYTDGLRTAAVLIPTAWPGPGMTTIQPFTWVALRRQS
jgi:hypothetical protein